ncbi:MAG: hypothetical protein CME68_07900 [Halobacteriovoraceae bacterium]|nr:hypothetical protein [Halobacteriovoraceae bacterium]
MGVPPLLVLTHCILEVLTDQEVLRGMPNRCSFFTFLEYFWVHFKGKPLFIGQEVAKREVIF